MAKTKSDISNNAIRIFLQKVGKFYDEIRGFSEFKPTLMQKIEILKFFEGCCCYCGREINIGSSMTEDHLIPMNKESLGLHAWGNVVPCCRACNARKHSKHWETYLESLYGLDDCVLPKTKIRAFLAEYRYNPNLELGVIANNLYQDVGAVAMTLIDLRFRQAEAVITRVHTDELSLLGGPPNNSFNPTPR
jgi:hypothetical protein